MKNSDGKSGPDLGRRNMLRSAALLAGAGALAGAGLAAGTATAATKKIAQKTVNYQPTPRFKSHCEICAQWQAPNGCKLVDGEISPNGWCSLYSPKA